MPLFETESIVLRSYNLSEADRIIVFFTRNYGMVRGVAKGARRLKSRFGSTLEPFSTVQLTFFQKEDRELVSVQSVELAASRFGAASEPEYLQTFAYLSELLMAIVPPHDPSETVYRMTAACLDVPLAGPADLAALRLYFELWLLRLGGYLPGWRACARCSRTLDAAEPASLRTDFHLECSRCRPASGAVQVDPAHRSLFDRAQAIPPQEFVKGSADSAGAVNDLSELLKRIVSQVVGREIRFERELAVGP